MKKNSFTKDKKLRDLMNQIYNFQNSLIDIKKEDYPEIDIKIWRRLYCETLYMTGILHAVLFTYDISLNHEKLSEREIIKGT